MEALKGMKRNHLKEDSDGISENTLSVTEQLTGAYMKFSFLNDVFTLVTKAVFKSVSNCINCVIGIQILPVPTHAKESSDIGDLGEF